MDTADMFSNAGPLPVASDRCAARAAGSAILLRYHLLSLIPLLVIVASYLRDIEFVGWFTPLFVGAVYATYAVIYSLPVLALVLGLHAALWSRAGDVLFGRFPRGRRLVPQIFAVVGFSALGVLLFADQFIYHLYGFHLNGFVWNLVFTPGGFESLGGSTSTTVSFTIIIAAIVVVQIALLLIARMRIVERLLGRLLRRRAVIAAIVLVVATGAFERIAYGVCRLRGYAPVLVASNAFPLYLPTTFNGIARKLGWEGSREAEFSVSNVSFRLQYPLRPLLAEPVAHPLNIVMLVAESLRFDMLEPGIMPATWQFSERAIRFDQHYSGGNGTRMAMFALFYGLYGNYWFPFLDEQRGPVLIDRLLEQNYQMEMFTSAKFSYPEFDRTIFARIPRQHLHEGTAQPKWRRDRENVDALLAFLEHRDPGRPFMTFMFFESPHANYYFPTESIIRKPYAEDLNYATMDLKKDIGLIKNRYINACNHLDGQHARILKYLEEHQLLDSTIVILTGDHGEEFMENGRWGHNSTFSEWQTRPPMVLWIPGEKPRVVTRLTSHMDLPATLLPLLGVTSPVEDYSLGRSLLAETGPESTVISDWSSLAYVDAHHKAVFPLKTYGFREQTVTTRQDVPVTDKAAFFKANGPQITQVMKDMTRFSR